MKLFYPLGLLLALLCSPLQAADYTVTTLRAAPGKLAQLLDAARAYRHSRDGKVLLMRHSQGDQWDLLLLEPSVAGAPAAGLPAADFSQLADFQLSMLAVSDTGFAELQRSAASSGLYHIEMFNALAGRAADLIDQRERENQYLAATGQVTNAVFVTTFGSDVDVFTIGFHHSLASFAQDPKVTSAQAEQAARDAGFVDRADLGFYLRALLTGHHDTLAGPVSD